MLLSASLTIACICVEPYGVISSMAGGSVQNVHGVCKSDSCLYTVSHKQDENMGIAYYRKWVLQNTLWHAQNCHLKERAEICKETFLMEMLPEGEYARFGSKITNYERPRRPVKMFQ